MKKFVVLIIVNITIIDYYEGYDEANKQKAIEELKAKYHREYEFNDYMEGYNDSMEAAIKIAEQLDSV